MACHGIIVLPDVLCGFFSRVLSGQAWIVKKEDIINRYLGLSFTRFLGSVQVFYQQVFLHFLSPHEIIYEREKEIAIKVCFASHNATLGPILVSGQFLIPVQFLAWHLQVNFHD